MKKPASKAHLKQTAIHINIPVLTTAFAAFCTDTLINQPGFQINHRHIDELLGWSQSETINAFYSIEHTLLKI